MIKTGIRVRIGGAISSSRAHFNNIRSITPFQGLLGNQSVANPAFSTSPRCTWNIPSATRRLIESQVLLSQKVTVITGTFCAKIEENVAADTNFSRGLKGHWLGLGQNSCGSR